MIELRKTGIDVVGDVPWGTHFCYFYETTQDLLDTLVPFFTEGLNGGEYCLWIISNSERLTPDEAKEGLRRALPDLERHLAQRNLEIVTHDEWFRDGDTFDLQGTADRFRAKLDEALARGYVGMRANGSPAWLQKSDREGFRAFERALDGLFHDQRIIASCSYPLASTSGDEIFDITGRHQFAIARRNGQWEVYETPELKKAKAEIARLNDELEQRVIERTQELRALSARLQSAREQEGIRIAREIHDELGSVLTALKWDLQVVDDELVESAKESPQTPALRSKIAAMLGSVDTTVSIVKRIASEMRPSLLDDLGLAAAIDWQARRFQERTGIRIRCDLRLTRDDLNQEQSTALFRIFQEALTNVLRHARASRVDVTIVKEAGSVALTITDDGRGITESEKAGPSAIGLLGMRERAHLMGGGIDITGVAGQGTTVTARIPIDRAGGSE